LPQIMQHRNLDRLNRSDAKNQHIGVCPSR
jgi:hypothetical protein